MSLKIRLNENANLSFSVRIVTLADENESRTICQISNSNMNFKTDYLKLLRECFQNISIYFSCTMKTVEDAHCTHTFFKCVVKFDVIKYYCLLGSGNFFLIFILLFYFIHITY
jgi:hypothetical protein